METSVIDKMFSMSWTSVFLKSGEQEEVTLHWIPCHLKPITACSDPELGILSVKFNAMRCSASVNK
jgi:hypothetical protein